MSRNELIQIGPQQTGLATRVRDWAMRSLHLGPWNPKDPAIARYFGGRPASSGVSVNEDSALALSAVWAAVTMVSDDVASTPLMLYRRVGNGKERYDGHPLYTLLHDEPNPEMSSMVWRRTMHAHLMIWQNAYAEIERDGAGRPVGIWPLVPESVAPYRENGRLRYRVTNPSGTQVHFDAADMIHLVGQSHDGSVGCSIVARARESIGLALAAERFGGAFFGNGATFGGIISYPGPKPNDLVEKSTREVLEARHAGVERSHRLLALYGGAKYERLGIPPNDAQFLETRNFQIREVARWFKVPPHKLADLADATFSNVEQQNLDYYQSRLRPDFVLWEQELRRKLIAKSERRIQVIEHVTQGLLQADAAGRAALYPAQFNVGAVMPNEIRRWEGLNDIAGGDRAFVPLNMIPLDRVDEYVDSIIKKSEPPPAPPPPPSEPEPEETEDERDWVTVLARVETLTAERSAAQTGEAAALELAEEAQAGRRAAEQRAEDLAAAQAEAEKARDEALAALSHEKELRDGAEVALAAEQAERAREAAELASALEEGRAAFAAMQEHRDREQARADAAEASIGKMQEASQAVLADLQALSSERDDLSAKVADRDAVVAAVTAGLHESRAAHASQVEATATLTAERDALLAAQEALRIEHDAAVAALSTACDEALTRAVAAENRHASATAALEAADARSAELAAAVTAARDDVHGLAVECDTLRTAQETALAAAQAADVARQAAESRAVEAERQATEAGASRANAEAAKVAAQQALDAQREDFACRVTGMIAAQRALVVDAMRRVVVKESDRARRHQATPQKLRAWTETFYSDHVDTITEALRPVVAATLAWRLDPGDPDAVARTIAEAHCQTSQEQLRMVLAVEDMPGALERMLQRWETTRPEAVADRLMQEGVTHVRSL